jgi:eukaryotic-like serine/threonine-protein kinase
MCPVSSLTSPPREIDFKKRLGEVLVGRYRIESVISSGGQGVVYRAFDSKDNEAVAVKVLRDEMALDPDSRERMFREAQALASLLGTAAVRIYDQGWTTDNAHFLVMELLDGNDLETALTRLEANGNRVEPAQLIEILRPVVDTLERAHGHGIVHRDLKPANVFLTKSGEVRLLDFGFAKFTRLRGLTLTGFVAGSPSYIAPEMWLQGSAKIDCRVDVYSLGAVAFRALTGRPPFVGKSVADVYRAATSAARPKLTEFRPELRPDVDHWAEHALAVDPEGRFMTVRALLNALTSSLGLSGQTQRKGPLT